MKRVAFALLLFSGPVGAEGLAAGRVIRAGTVLGASDVIFVRAVPGGLSDPSEVIGREARVTLYAGRPLRAEDLRPPALVDRNQLVTLVFKSGGLSLQAEGRALSRGGEGERIRVMNLQSRVTVFGTVLPDGTVFAGGR
ncbi:flagellar basal body P-ring formation chaperone FlgA [Falsigemmobacter intermedius]|uniref:Flagella basal body P-ring formation protein FlgA n=1 Tax=Falsigemmobacter intermedius TaxID=1553448 RepID=A0A451GG53_9RHOB|nr:flagellar basal body P-ring formation chaperone FlgA [Falsigemmobacter intermedius]RWY34354.1 flagellar basal body P-ring formation protein FlgA [Falsigemmobacter intermedius]